MEIKQTAVAGTVESSDIMITLVPNDAKEIEINLDSSVEKQFGKQIRKVIKETLALLNVEAVKVVAVDKGALDCTIQARTIAATYRAAGIENYDWKEISTWNA